jgi:glycosyltransferase involved in cell wall biosynthesis
MSIPKLNRWIHSRLVSGRDALVLMARDSFWDLYIRSHQKLFIKIIPNGISIDQVKIWGEGQKFEFKKKCGIEDNNSLVVGTVGMLRPDRQPWRYLPIFKRVLKGFGNNVHFIIAGGGPELERLKRLVKEQGLENNIHFPGLVLDPRLAFSIMDLYISLNVGSITGISVLEAASSGLPVIAIQMLDNYNRKEDDWIWSSTNDDEIAEKIITMLKSKELRDKLAAKQKVYVDQNFSNDRMVNDYLEVYKRVLTRNKGI